jgi:hypothetical protein
VLSSLLAEDAGEVRFQAGPAQSLARLEVEGKLPRRGEQERSIVYPKADRLAAGPRHAASLLSPPLEGSLGTGHRGQRVSWGVGGELGMKGNRLMA